MEKSNRHTESANRNDDCLPGTEVLKRSGKIGSRLTCITPGGRGLTIPRGEDSTV